MTRKYPHTRAVRPPPAPPPPRAVRRARAAPDTLGTEDRGAALLNREYDPCFRPVLFEAVVLALRRREDVDDDRPEVDQDPVRRRGPLSADRLRALVPQAADDATRDRLELPFGSTRADHEVVGHRRQLTEIEQDDVGGLLVFGQLDDASSELEGRPLGRGGSLGTMRQAIGARSTLSGVGGGGGGGGFGHDMGGLVWWGFGPW